jgi:hypothetical protein
MPNLPNNTLVPAARVPIWDKVTNFVTREWYRWFYNTYIAIEAGRRYGSFYSTTTFTPAVINTAYAITFNNTYERADGSELVYGVYIDHTITSRVYVDITATYNFQFSAQLKETGGGTKQIYIWPRINGVDVADSATNVTLANGLNAAAVAAWNFVLNLQAGDYFELIYSASSTNVSIPYVAASSPVPAIPSVILTVTSCVGG